MVVDEPELDTLSTQLENQEVFAYAQVSMNTYVANAISEHIPFDLNSLLVLISINPQNYITMTSNSAWISTSVIEGGKTCILEAILNSKSQSFVNMKATYKTFMQQMYRIISKGNIDNRVLVKGGSWYDVIVLSSSSPVELIKSLRKMCRKNVDYPINTFIFSLNDLFDCKQGNNNIIDFVETIKLNYDIVTN